MLFTQVVRRRAIPFEVSADDVRNDDLVDIERRNRILLSLDDSQGW
jgi:antitoxin component of RelBE/YafQ-DinJ toxin-antitoxin module